MSKHFLEIIDLHLKGCILRQKPENRKYSSSLEPSRPKTHFEASTYKSCSGTILGFNDYGSKSSIAIQCLKKPFVKVKMRNFPNYRDSEKGMERTSLSKHASPFLTEN